MKKTHIILLLFFCATFSSYAQKVIINYYDKTMHVVDIPDYNIYYQSEPEYRVSINDSAIVAFFIKHISNLKQCDTIPQKVNSLVRIVYEYKNGNFDVLTFDPWAYRKNGICKNGRMYYYDKELEKVVIAIIKNPNKDVKTGQVGNNLIKSVNDYIYKNEKLMLNK